MLQINAYKLLLVSAQTVQGMVKDIRDEDWLSPLPGLGRSFDWVLGHYAAVEDWFLHHLNDQPYELPQAWQDTYWADTSGPVDPARAVGRTGVTAGFTETRQRLYSALKTDLFHLNRFVKPGYFPAAVKTRGDAWLFISAHAYWHVGEVESLRKKLGYPYLGTGGIHH
jgi:hypothetical protein